MYFYVVALPFTASIFVYFMQCFDVVRVALLSLPFSYVFATVTINFSLFIVTDNGSPTIEARDIFFG